MERDEESGLQCHGRRYFAPWIGRWTSADPIGVGDGVNRYAYARNCPVGRSDRGGMTSVGDLGAKADAQDYRTCNPDAGSHPADPAQAGAQQAFKLGATSGAERYAITQVEGLLSQAIDDSHAPIPSPLRDAVVERATRPLREDAQRRFDAAERLNPDTAETGWFIGFGGMATGEALLSTVAGRLGTAAVDGAEGLAARRGFAAIEKEVGNLSVSAGRRAATGNSTSVPVRPAIEVPPLRSVNPRMLRPTEQLSNRSQLERMAKEMMDSDFSEFSPIEATEIDGRLYIDDGHHRAAAAARAKLPGIPVLVRTPSTEAEATEIFRAWAALQRD